MHFVNESESERHTHVALSKIRFGYVSYTIVSVHAENNSYRDAHAVSTLSIEQMRATKRNESQTNDEKKATQLSQVHTYR